jgi:hypothetical protein
VGDREILSYFEVVVGLVWSHDPESYIAYAIGTASHARQVKGDDPDKKGYPGPPGWGFGVELTTPHSKKLLLRMSSREISWIDLMIMDGKGLDIQK